MKMIAILLLAMAGSYQCAAQSIDTTEHKPGRQLETVTITGKTPLVRQEADRIVYDIQADPQSKLSNTLDMMRKVPYLSVDEDDNILLKGSRSYKVFINGRPSGLVANNPKEVLRSMPASTVKSIEVIISPPAKYDAEGLVGIINIITAKQTHNGYKGSVNAQEKEPVGGPGAGCSLTLKQSRFGIAILAGISRYNVPETDGVLTRSSMGRDQSTLYQHTSSQTNSHTAYAGIELSYEYDSLNLISGQANWDLNKSRGLSTQVSSLAGVNYQQQYRIDNNNSNESGGPEAMLSYQRGFRANKDRLLSFAYRYMTNNTLLYNDLMLSDEINYNVPDYRQYNSEGLAEHTAQVDYVHPIKNLTIEGGLKGSFRDNKSEFQYSSLNSITGEYETNQTRSNIFNNSQDILAAYNSYTYESARWQLKAGIRVEKTIIDAGYSQALGSLWHQYLNLLPVIVISRKFKDNSSLCFSFSKRVQRPSTAELNPFVDRSDPNFESSGNPYLQPITSNAYQLSYLRSTKLTLNISIGGMYFNSIFNAFPYYDPSTNVTLTRYENYGKGRVIKTNIYLNYPIIDKWNATLNADIRHIAIYGIIDKSSFKNSGFGVYAYASSGYSFDNGWRVNTDITYKMGGISLPMGRTNDFIASSFSVSKNMIESKLTVSAAVNNPLTTYRYADETITGFNFIQTSGKQSYHRRFTLSLNYRFGKLKEDIRKNKRSIDNDGNG